MSAPRPREGRVYTRLRPLVTFLSPQPRPPPAPLNAAGTRIYGGVAVELGVEHRTETRGVWFGAGLTPLFIGGEPLAAFTTHFFIGWARERFGIALALGTGYHQFGDDRWGWLYAAVQLGITLRAGSTNGTHFRARSTVSLAALIGNTTEATLNILLRPRWWLNFEVGYQGALNHRVYGSLGVQVALTMRREQPLDLLLVSGGVIAGPNPQSPLSKRELNEQFGYSTTDIGPILTLGYERRW